MIEELTLEKRETLWSQGYWDIPDGLDVSKFDFTWRPFKYDRPYIHEFGTQHQKTGGPKFIVPNNEGIKYQDFQHAIKLEDNDNRCWRPLINNAIMDFSWHPDANDPPYIYVFGNQWYDAETMPTYQYRVKGATEKKYINDVRATLLPNKDNWEIPDNVDDSNFDYSWTPNPHEPPVHWQFGTQWQKTGGPVFKVQNSTGVKYVDFQRVMKLPTPENRCWRPLIPNSTIDFSWHPDENDPPYIYVFGNQWYDFELMPTYQYKVKGATEKKYMTDIKATLLPDSENRCWRPLVPNATIDQSWVPHPWDPPYIYVFGNQWYDVDVMPTYQYRMQGATEKKYVTDFKATLLPNKDNWEIPDDIEDSFDYSWVPHPHEPPMNWQFGTQHQKTGGPKYISNKTLEVKYCDQLIAKKLPNMRNWRIIEPIVNDSFDFSWHPDYADGKYNYVFGNQYHCSENMPTLIYKMKNAEHNKYINNIKSNLKIDCIPYTDSIFDAISAHKEDTKYICVSNTELKYDDIIVDDLIPHVHIIDNVAAIVPKGTKTHVYDKLHDYPYIKYHKLGYTNRPLDIIFLSNGEKGAEENYEHLLSLVKGLPNNIIGLKNIKGRVASQHEAANMSNTPWYFLINGKCKVNPNFDFSWQPDRICTARHYIFRATNPVNGLEYGHMAIVANNKRLTLNTTGKGLDFTLDSPHAIVNMNSGIGMFNTSDWDTWRTAFREVIKLKYNVEMFNDKASKERLHVWTTVANGDFSEWALRGANDAVKYYDSVDGDFDSLKLSYDWEWLKTKFDSYRP